MYDNEKRAFIAIADKVEVCLAPQMANRHGLIAGATGTGKTVTLQNLAETFSEMGVAVFAADVKGDLSGVAAVGGNKSSVVKRVEEYHLAAKGFTFQAFPVQFWDILAVQGLPVRAAAGDMGPLMLSRLLNLNDTQSAVLTVVFKIAKDENLEIIDLKDLQKLLLYVAENSNKYGPRYGNLSAASIGAIQRGLVALEHDGIDDFFGEPSLDIMHLMQTKDGKGVINILAADKLINNPKIYTTFLMWLLTKLFEVLPETGDLDKPKLVFFFDEAHLLFNDAPKALMEKIEQVVRLIRSKGVGIYFISQSPADIPDTVLGQLGNRIQHALRAYTPKDRKALKAAAQTFRPNPAFDTETAIVELGIGEALVSLLDDKGVPHPVERAYILPPASQIGPLDSTVREQMLKASLLYHLYRETQDRVSAYEKLTEHTQNTPDPKEAARQQKATEKARAAEERRRQQTAAKNRRFIERTVTTVVAPVARDLLKSLFKK